MNKAMSMMVAGMLAMVACDFDDRSLGSTPDGVGAPCEHDPNADIQTYFATPASPACGGEACVYAEDRIISPDACMQDSDCNPVGIEPPFQCNIPDQEAPGSCGLADSWVLQRSMCAPTCETDADCQTDIASDTACETGFSCATLFAEGELCCRSLCLCNDDLPDTSEADALCQNPEATCG